MQKHISPATAPAARLWYPFPLVDRNARTYRVSFLVAEEATWDHRFHDLEGRELASGELALHPADYQFIQSSCDHAVGTRNARFQRQPANGNAAMSAAHAGAIARPA